MNTPINGNAPWLPKALWIGLLAWLGINLLQAALTELLHDEAYYWVFSRQLSIVYFDQMPGVAFFIRAGSSIIPGELGVRFLSVLVAPITLFLYYRLSGARDPKWFLAVAFSMVAVHFNGFLTSPDSVLSFTLALFLLAYKSYCEDSNWSSSILLLLAAAAVGYSKYQGILFILVLAAMSTSLWRKSTFWMVVIGFSILLAPIYLADPHTVEVTLRYQLVERGTQSFSLLKPLDFLSSQLVIWGPFASPFVIWAWIFYKPQQPYLKSLKRASWVYFGLLVLLSMRTKVEGNWSAPMLGCLIIFAANYYAGLSRSWPWTRFVAIFSFACFLLLRVYLVWDFLPPAMTRQMRPETHGWKDWALKVQDAVQGEPVIFWNTYQMPSKYWYYAGTPTTCISNSSYRKNQFTLLPMEAELQGKAVWLAAGFPHTTGAIEIETPDGNKTYLARLPRFYSYSEIRIQSDVPPRVKAGDTLHLTAFLHNEHPTGKPFLAPTDSRVSLAYSWIGDCYDCPWGVDTLDLRGQNSDTDRTMSINPAVPAQPGQYSLSLHILSDNYQLSYNSGRIPVIVE